MESLDIKTEEVEWDEEKLDGLGIVKNEELTGEINIKDEFDESIQDTFNENTENAEIQFCNDDFQSHENIIEGEYTERIEVKMEAGYTVAQEKRNSIQTTESSNTQCFKQETYLNQEGFQSVASNEIGLSVANFMRSAVNLFHCTICNFITNSIPNLQLHIRTHKAEMPYACDVCDYKCAVKGNLAYHMVCHIGEKPYACHLCNYRGNDKQRFDVHMLTHSSDTTFACDLCDNKFSKKSSLTLHLRAHQAPLIQEKRFACKLCDHKATTNGNLVKHVRTHTGEKPFKCNVCNYKSSQKANLTLHMRKHQAMDTQTCIRAKPALCEVNIKDEFVEESIQETVNEITGNADTQFCNDNIQSPDNIIKEEYTEPIEVKMETEDTVLQEEHNSIQTTESSNTQCLKQETYLDQENVLNEKELSVSNISSFDNDVKLFQCAICTYNCNSITNLTLHIRTHKGVIPSTCVTNSSNMPFACYLCTYKCSVKYKLTRHLQTHSTEKPFACDVCSFKAFTKTHLVEHIRIHTGEKPFACTLCNYKSSRKSALKVHMRTHSSEGAVKSFVCDVCNYKCIAKSTLVIHMRSHTGEKPFACDLCNYRCASKSRLVEHSVIHGGKKSFACHLCNYQSNRKSALTVHLRTHTVQSS